MKIAVDAMGGDHAPGVVVAGALMAQPHCMADLILVGQEDRIRLIPGLRRPTLAVSLPTPEGRVLLADVGAHAEAVTDHLTQSAALAHAYLKVVDALESLRLGLLNIGKECIKGKVSTHRA
jgi:fatty acid/phospholipid biosynthesis enzyme